MRNLVAFVLVMLIAVAAAALDLYPSIDVTTGLKTTAVVSVCYATGYEELDGNGDPIDPAIVFEMQDVGGRMQPMVTSYAWTDNAAMLAWYRAQLNNELRKWRASAWTKTLLANPPDMSIE